MFYSVDYLPASFRGGRSEGVGVKIQLRCIHCRRHRVALACDSPCAGHSFTAFLSLAADTSTFDHLPNTLVTKRCSTALTNSIMSKAELLAKRERLKKLIAQKKWEQEAFNNHPPSPYRGSYGAPSYGHYHSGGRGGYSNLSLHNNPPQPSIATPSPTPPHLAPQQTFATSNTRQMMTKNVFDREKQQRERRAAKNARRKNDERARLRPGEEVVVEGIKFQLRPDRSKLIRQHGE